jgi:DNA-binding transcriptional regulator YhcF (GntR family)
MSIRLMSEVWRTNLPTVEKMVLLIIADHASDDGTEAWPSQATIATKASISIRTVQRAVNSLVEAKYLWMAKGQGGSVNCREDRRPHKYTINIKRLRGDNVSSRDERVDFDDADGATLAPSTGRHSRPMNHPNDPSNETPVGVIKAETEFDLFWKIYPLKVGKAAAKKAWEKAVKEAGVDKLVNGALRYANDPNRHPSFTAHAATWLNAGRWNDEALPPRILTAEEKREAELKVSREKSAREREEYQRWQMEQEELKTKAIPMPDSVKDLLQRVRKR